MSAKLPKIKLPRKPKYVALDNTIEFLSLFLKIEKKYDHCFILESMGEESFDSRYGVIGFSPEMLISSRDGKLFIDGKEYEVDNPYYALREIIPVDIIGRNYAGGLVGYIGYDAMNYFEPSLQLKSHPTIDAFQFGVYTDGVIFDSMTGELVYFYFNKDRSEIIKNIAKTSLPDTHLSVEFSSASKTKEEHSRMVEDAKVEIVKGNTFQCQIGFQNNYKISGDATKIYVKLREINPSPHMFYVKFGETKLIGASPELLFRLRQGEVESFPLAGTTKRGANSEEDRDLARVLLNDPKEIAEHNMLVDLHRNDVGRLARFGSVKVRRLMDIKKFSHVQHISSEVVGLIDYNDDMFSGLAKVFPAGTLSGAPKIESMKIIQEIEGDARGPYGGSVGHFGFNGDSTHVIPIRTLFLNDEDAYARASGGIVYDSIAENEYLEIKRKSAAVAKALEVFMDNEPATGENVTNTASEITNKTGNKSSEKGHNKK